MASGKWAHGAKTEPPAAKDPPEDPPKSQADLERVTAEFITSLMTDDKPNLSESKKAAVLKGVSQALEGAPNLAERYARYKSMSPSKAGAPSTSKDGAPSPSKAGAPSTKIEHFQLEKDGTLTPKDGLPPLAVAQMKQDAFLRGEVPQHLQKEDFRSKEEKKEDAWVESVEASLRETTNSKHAPSPSPSSSKDSAHSEFAAALRELAKQHEAGAMHPLLLGEPPPVDNKEPPPFYPGAPGGASANTVCAPPRAPPNEWLREAGNAAFKAKDFHGAISCYTKALGVLPPDASEEAAGLLVNRAIVHSSLADKTRGNTTIPDGHLLCYVASRRDALAALRLVPHHAKALFRLSAAERALNRPVASLAALSSAAQHCTKPADFNLFHKQATQLGAWRLPPPLASLWEKPENEHRVTVLKPDTKKGHLRVTRDQFMPHVQRGDPVVISGFADVSKWSWNKLIRNAQFEEAYGQGREGEVLVSASGCVPDYCGGRGKAGSSHGGGKHSSIEGMKEAKLCLSELFERVRDGAAFTSPDKMMVEEEAQHHKDHIAPDDDVIRRFNEDKGGDGVSTSAPKSKHPPILCNSERVYSYGKRWMLNDTHMNELVHSAWPCFLMEGDLTTDTSLTADVGPEAPKPIASTKEEEEKIAARVASGVFAKNKNTTQIGKSAVTWVGSSGTLTPLHYDLSDGILAQVIGSKRVWLIPPEEMDNCYLRSTKRPGMDNWERQSQASLHQDDFSKQWPNLTKTKRFVADLEPGDCLYIPSMWLHEVHAREASFSLGWRIAMRDVETGKALERNAGQKLERLANQVKTGQIGLLDSFTQALDDPNMLALLADQIKQAGGVDAAKELMSEGGLEAVLKANGAPGERSLADVMGASGLGSSAGPSSDSAGSSGA